MRVGITVGLLLSAILPPAQAAENAHTNVVLIVADYMGYSDTQPYGASDIRTPNLLRLANEGVRLTDAYATAALCSPSRAALLTGRYQHRFGLEGSIRRGALPQSEVTFAKVLRKRGYATAMIGKWHLGLGGESGPNAHGFDESLFFNDSSIDYYSHRTQFGAPGLFENGRPVDVEGYSTDIFTDRAISFIQNHVDRPFFVYLAYNATLPPLQPPERPDDIRARDSGAPAGDSWYRSTRADYVKVVESLDAGIGRILDQIDKSDVSDETLVIFTCDHGGTGLSRNTPLSHGFRSLWEGGIRVPCIIRWPGRFAAGTVSSQQASLLDLMPTILAATETPIPAQVRLDGLNLVPLLNGNRAESKRELFWRSPPSSRSLQKAVRQGKWKLIEDSNTLKLFDLDADISERRDIADIHPKIVAQLHWLLRKWEVEVGSK